MAYSSQGKNATPGVSFAHLPSGHPGPKGPAGIVRYGIYQERDNVNLTFNSTWNYPGTYNISVSQPVTKRINVPPRDLQFIQRGIAMASGLLTAPTLVSPSKIPVVLPSHVKTQITSSFVVVPTEAPPVVLPGMPTFRFSASM